MNKTKFLIVNPYYVRNQQDINSQNKTGVRNEKKEVETKEVRKCNGW